MYTQIFTVIAPIIFIALLGFTWSFFKLRYDGKFISKIVMDVGAPCLILSTMQKTGLPSGEVLLMSKITVTGLAFLFLFNTILIRITGVPLRSYLSSLTFANTGNMGVPICLFAFGEKALALALIIFMVTSLFHFSIGVSLVGDRNPLATLVRSPVFYSALASFYLVFSGQKLPDAVFNTVDILGAMAIPLMLFSLGVSLQSLEIRSFSSSLFFAIMRLCIGFSVGWILCWIFNLHGMIKGVVLIQSSMPSAVFNYLLAFSYNREPEKAAGIVVFSTLISFVTLPLLLWLVL